MELTLNSYHIPKRIKNQYYFDDTFKATAFFRRSGSLSSVEIKGKVYNCFHEHFGFFKNMVNEAQLEIEAQKKLDDDCLIAITQLKDK
ncbi:MAG: hypothetical protein COB36_12105 [Alphaproteobacteria bacterium]|nr:MAG: hypothetical protein COB36_12105 [Alphaproteobacteria bacterium]